jgi:polar amino acid transport system substrate-binding protein
LAIDSDVARELAPGGALRAAINLGNPVLARGCADEPGGVTVDLAREIARRLDVPSSLVCVDAARKSFQALLGGTVDIAFLAAEPERARKVWFTDPYVVIEAVYAVRGEPSLRTISEIDAPNLRIAVKEGSAYDLYLTRTLSNATVVRGDDEVQVFRDQETEVVAGLRQSMNRLVSSDSSLRLIEHAFMQIRQAVAIGKDKSPAARGFLQSTLDELKTDGFIDSALA